MAGLDFLEIFIGGKVNVRDYNPLFDDPIACPHLLHLYNLQKDLSYTLTKASQVAGATYWTIPHDVSRKPGPVLKDLLIYCQIWVAQTCRNTG